MTAPWARAAGTTSRRNPTKKPRKMHPARRRAWRARRRALLNELWFLDVFSGSGRATAFPGSACVSHAVFGVPPNTDRTGFCLNAAKPKKNSWERNGKEVGRGTRPTATGTVALPNELSWAGRDFMVHLSLDYLQEGVIGDLDPAEVFDGMKVLQPVHRLKGGQVADAGKVAGHSLALDGLVFADGEKAQANHRGAQGKTRHPAAREPQGGVEPAPPGGTGGTGGSALDGLQHQSGEVGGDGRGGQGVQTAGQGGLVFPLAAGLGAGGEVLAETGLFVRSEAAAPGQFGQFLGNGIGHVIIHTIHKHRLAGKVSAGSSSQAPVWR